MTKRYLIALGRLLSTMLLLIAILWAANFPYNTDAPPNSAELAAARKYYTDIYRKPADATASAESDFDRKYQEAAERTTKIVR